MPLRDVLHLIAEPFLGAQREATDAEAISRSVEVNALSREGPTRSM
jgi:hypothetical protein